MPLLRIIAPHFVAAYDTNSGRIAPIISYMGGWTVAMIKDYCLKKGWIIEEVNDGEINSLYTM